MCSLGIFMIGFATFDILFVRKAVPERCTSLFCEKYFHLKLLFIQPQRLWISRMIYSVLCLFHSSNWKDESNFLEKIRGLENSTRSECHLDCTSLGCMSISRNIIIWLVKAVLEKNESQRKKMQSGNIPFINSRIPFKRNNVWDCAFKVCKGPCGKLCGDSWGIF